MIHPICIDALGRSVNFRMDLDPDFVSDRWILDSFAAGHVYEPEVCWVMLRALRPGDTAIDVGANVGFFTCLMASLVGPTGNVVAFEPSEQNLWRFCENIKLNGFTQVAHFSNPVSDCEEVVNFYLNADNSGGDALWNPALWHENVKTKERQRVRAATSVTLAAACPNVKARLLKIDTEGAEQKVLEGANTLLTRHDAPPFILAEFNTFGLAQMGSTPDTLRQYMKQQGYDAFFLYPQGLLPKLIPTTYRFAPRPVQNVLFSTPDAVGEIFSGAGA